MRKDVHGEPRSQAEFPGRNPARSSFGLLPIEPTIQSELAEYAECRIQALMCSVSNGQKERAAIALKSHRIPDDILAL